MHTASSERASYDVDVIQGRSRDVFEGKDILHITPLTKNIFDWMKLLQNADEIHIAASSVYTLCEAISASLQGQVYFHNIRDYTYIDPNKIILPYVSQSKQPWKIVDYAVKQYR
jgi:hypothetical protein